MSILWYTIAIIACMHTYLCIIGRSPEVSVEELLVVSRRLGFVVDITRECVVLQGDLDPVALLSRLGGTVKIARVETIVDDWKKLTKDLWLRTLRNELHGATGKFQFGYSVYGAGAEARKALYALGLSLKKHLKLAKISARLVSSQETSLSSVVVRKNNLIGRELIVVQGERCYIGRTVAVQDFDSYGLRDFGRPARNMERGLLPPKLAQVLLNLAAVSSDTKLLDPFCGGGTIIQEALLMGLSQVWGSDIDQKAIAEAQANTKWLSENFKMPQPTLQVADALDLQKVYRNQQFDAIVTEPYLGPARMLRQKSLLRSDLARIVTETTGLYNHFFRSAAMVVPAGGVAVVVFPVMKLFGQEQSVCDLRQLESYGWELQKPEVSHRLPHAKLSARGQLLYAREDQIVLREIMVWKRSV